MSWQVNKVRCGQFLRHAVSGRIYKVQPQSNLAAKHRIINRHRFSLFHVQLYQSCVGPTPPT